LSVSVKMESSADSGDQVCVMLLAIARDPHCYYTLNPKGIFD